MKILELEITKLRGIHHIHLKPNGENLVIWGPNGSGKSAIIDAIDFLLTGEITRLTGEGTQGISTKAHGPHIKYTPEDSEVRAIISVQQHDEPIEIIRKMSSRNELIYDEKYKELLDPIVAIAKRGQHILTRREILNFVTAKKGERAQQIQELLNITEVDSVRKNLKKVRNDYKKSLVIMETTFDSAKGDIISTTEHDKFNEVRILEFINSKRKKLGGSPIKELKIKEIKKGIETPEKMASSEINLELLNKDITNLTKLIEAKDIDKFKKLTIRLFENINQLRQNPELLHELHYYELTEKGIELIEDTGSCPLCDTEWPPGKLKEHLSTKLASSKIAEKCKKDITKDAKKLLMHAKKLHSEVMKIKEFIVFSKYKEGTNIITWIESLDKYIKQLESPIDTYDEDIDDSHFSFYKPSNISQNLKQIVRYANETIPKPTSNQTSWDVLTRLEENLKVYIRCKNEYEKINIGSCRAEELYETFEKNRKEVLSDLFSQINTEFCENYIALHGNDEKSFKAKLEPDNTGLNFEVDFHGRGAHPPQALHSEGHQDSMGLCLFLSLSERLNKGIIGCIILDDVVMSIDSGHRRAICHLLMNKFSDKQFIITTHERAWAFQLKTTGVTTDNGLFEFYNWDIDSGPMVNYQTDLWEMINIDLEKTDVASAAGRLRRGLEAYLSMVCENLSVKIIYKISGKHELGHYLIPLLNEYREILKKGKKVAESWENKLDIEKMSELDNKRKELYTAIQEEQWIINENVHYNWESYDSKDFIPVVEAFRSFIGLFSCKDCGSLLQLTHTDNKPSGVRCHCTAISINLKMKPKQS